MNRLNLLASALCFCGLGALAFVFGLDSLVATAGQAVFAGSLALAGVLFLLAASTATLDVAGRTADLYDCSPLGDIAVGGAIFAGLTAVPEGSLGPLYVALVATGGASAVAFGVLGLAEKYDVR
jgi:hypothetical protein